MSSSDISASAETEINDDVFEEGKQSWNSNTALQNYALAPPDVEMSN
jgi:hypothetical protein